MDCSTFVSVSSLSEHVLSIRSLARPACGSPVDKDNLVYLAAGAHLAKGHTPIARSSIKSLQQNIVWLQVTMRRHAPDRCHAFRPPLEMYPAGCFAYPSTTGHHGQANFRTGKGWNNADSIKQLRFGQWVRRVLALLPLSPKGRKRTKLG